jgi:hypothetical protein
MDALIFMFWCMTSENVLDAFKDFALFAFVAYLISQGLVVYGKNEEQKDIDLIQQQVNANAKAKTKAMAQRIDMQKNAFAAKGKVADTGGGRATYLTDEQRALGKKLIEEARKAG